LEGREFPTSITWVKAHSGNAVADNLAGQYFEPVDELPLSQHYECPELQSLHSFHGLTILHDVLTQYPVRDCLKKKHRLRDQKQRQDHISKGLITEENTWPYTFTTINNGLKPTNHKTNRKTSNTTPFNFKRLAHILPTQARQHLWNPEIFPNGFCRICPQESENIKNNPHLDLSIRICHRP
jgi:hypothetical protein